jgi:hypothetical protein
MVAAAEKLGLSIETRFIEGHDPAYAVYKGAKQVFIGTRDAVMAFLSTYIDKRPLPYEGSMYGYRE